jgi:hypothetical protein
MTNHLFIFSEGVWLGEGKIHLNMLEEELVFFARWKVGGNDDKSGIECSQEIQVKGLSDIMTNRFLLSDFSPGTFSIVMENHAVGKVQGKGIISDDKIGWEFRVKEIGFEGFEFYEKKSDDLYSVHGEFSTSDDLRTTIHGKIWRQTNPKTGEET